MSVGSMLGLAALWWQPDDHKCDNGADGVVRVDYAENMIALFGDDGMLKNRRVLNHATTERIKK